MPAVQLTCCCPRVSPFPACLASIINPADAAGAQGSQRPGGRAGEPAGLCCPPHLGAPWYWHLLAASLAATIHSAQGRAVGAAAELPVFNHASSAHAVQVEVTRLLVASYFDIVRKNLQVGIR